MTRLALALMVWNGVSFILWGCVGCCRYMQEQAAGLGRRAVALAPATVVACVVGLLLLELTTRPVLALATATLHGLQVDPPHALSALTLMWMPLCGAAGAFLADRVLPLRHVVSEAIVIGATYWCLAVITSKELLEAGTVTPLPVAVGLLLLAMAIAGALIGLRLSGRGVEDEPAPEPRVRRRLTAADVAVLVSARNEEQSLPICLRAVTAIVPRENVFVASDGSTDGTAKIAREWGVNVVAIRPNGGKAKALELLIDVYSICDRFEVVLISDADAQPAPDYLEHALPLFDDPQVVAVAGHATPRWRTHWFPRWSMLFAAYRVRLYRVLQAMVRYGQTWRHCNVSYIVPGFSSLYRSTVLPYIDVAAPGLSVEDFNMTFAIHRKRLGRIAYTPKARSVSQEAYGFRDYYRQVKRWHLGFWQTIRRHGVWVSGFWLALGVFLVEMILQSLAFLLLPTVLVWFLVQGGEPVALLPGPGGVVLSPADLAIGVFLADYAVTLLVAVVDRKPILAIYGVAFVLLRWVDSFLFLAALPLAFITTSDGRWVSPKRI